MSDLKASLQQAPIDENILAAELIADSPLREVDPASIDELLDRVNGHLIAGVPHMLRANDDELLNKLVSGFRREATQWAIAEREKPKRGTPRTAKTKEPIDLSQAIDL